MTGLILPKASASMPGPFVVLGDPAIFDKVPELEYSPSAAGIGPTQPVRTAFELYAPRYAYAPGARIPIHCGGLTGDDPLEFIVIHDALTNRRIGLVKLPPGTVAGAFSCRRSGDGGCDFPIVGEIDTSGFGEGVTFVNVVARSGRISQPLFILLRRPEGPSESRVALMHPDFTWQAYNYAGGTSFYTPPGPRPIFSVSLRRPIDQRAVNDYHNARCTLPFIRLLGGAGIPVRSFSNHDLHDSGRFLDGIDVLLLCGHDEYWTPELRANIDAFLARGGRIACFSGNTNWWQCRLVGDTLHLSQEDRESPEPHLRASGQMFRSWVNNPIEPKLGLGYLPGGYAVRYYHPEREALERGLTLEDYEASRGITVAEPDHPIFAGTGLKAGDVFGADSDVMHVEVDAANLRGDGRLDRSRWRLTPRNLKVLGRTLIFTASYPSMNSDPAGLLHVAAVIAEVPGDRERGAVLHFGSVGWYRAIALQEPQCTRIALNAVRYLLDRSDRGRQGQPPAQPPARVPGRPGVADFDRRHFLAGAIVSASAASLDLASGPAEAQSSSSRAAEAALEQWAMLRGRANDGDPEAMEQLVRKLLPEESIGSETCGEIYALLDKAMEKGRSSALMLQYQLAMERFDALYPSTAVLAKLEQRLGPLAEGNKTVYRALDALASRNASALASLSPELERAAPQFEVARVVLALGALLASPVDLATAERRLAGGEVSSALALAVRGLVRSLRKRHAEALEDFERSSALGYVPARFLSARIRARHGATEAVKAAGLAELLNLAKAGNAEAQLTAVEIAVSSATRLSDIAPVADALKALASRGYGNAAYLLGFMHAAGVGLAQEPTEAVRYMGLCAVTRQRFAEFQMGAWSYEGYGTAVDKAAAFTWFEKAGADGEPRALHNQALMLLAGDGVPANPAAGRVAMRRSAELGLAEAKAWMAANGP